MTSHVHPDGTLSSCPDLLDTPPAAASDVMARAIEQHIDPPASFVPAVHDVRRDAVLAAAVAWALEGDWSRSQALGERLRDAVARYRGLTVIAPEEVSE